MLCVTKILRSTDRRHQGNEKPDQTDACTRFADVDHGSRKERDSERLSDNIYSTRLSWGATNWIWREGGAMSAFLLRSCRSTGLAMMDSSLLYSTRLQGGNKSCLARWQNNSFNTRRHLTTNKTTESSAKQTKNVASNEGGGSSQMLARFLGPKEMPPRWTFAWYREMALVCTVFGITGSSTMVLVSCILWLGIEISISFLSSFCRKVRPAVSEGLGLKGSMKEGPWSYRICSLVVMTPIYAALLVLVGTVFGRHQYFRHFSVKMWSRFGIPPEMIDQSFHETKKHFRKW
jgi:hypothetical protein